MKKKIITLLLGLSLIFMFTVGGLATNVIEIDGGLKINLSGKANPFIKSEVTLDVGEEIVLDDNYFSIRVSESERNSLKYSVSDEKILFVNSDFRKVVALAAGEAKIIVESSKYYGEINVKVRLDNFYEDPNLSKLTPGSTWTTNNEEKDGWRLYMHGSTKMDGQVEVVSEDGVNMIHYDYNSESSGTLFTQYKPSNDKHLQNGKLIPGEYYVQVDVKTENLKGDTYIRANQGNKAGEVTSEKLNGTNDWTTITTSNFRIDPADSYIKVELYGYKLTGDVYFKNLRVYRVITADYNSFMINDVMTVGLEEKNKSVEVVTYPASNIDFEYDYEVADESVATINRKGEITPLKYGYTNVKVTDVRYGYSKDMVLLVGSEGEINASVPSDLKVPEDTQLTIEVKVEGTANYTIFPYSDVDLGKRLEGGLFKYQTNNGKYYVEGNNVIYTPTKDYYSDAADTKDTFKVIVFDEEKGNYKVLPISVQTLPKTDSVQVIDYWLSTPYNQPLDWGKDKISDVKYQYYSTKINGEEVFDGGYIQVTSYDVEVLYPGAKESQLNSDQLKKKADLYSKVVGQSLEGTDTITTANGGTVKILQGGKAQQIKDRYYDSTRRLVYGVLYDYVPPKDYQGYDTFKMNLVNNIHGESVVTEVECTVYVLPAEEHFKFDSIDFSGVYLLSSSEWLEETRVAIENGDPYLNKWLTYYKNALNGYAPTGDPESARGPLEQLAILYQVTGDESYAEKAWEQMKLIVQDLDFSGGTQERLSWGKDSNGFLDAAMVTYSVSFAYNYIKDTLTPEEKEMVMEALYLEGFYWFETIQNVNVLMHGNNHNLLICGNLSIAALSVMSYDGEIKVKNPAGQEVTINIRSMAADVFATAFRFMQIALVHYSETGGFPEGPSYSYYAHRNIISLLATLYNLYGMDEVDNTLNAFGLEDVKGIMEYPKYPIYSSSPNHSSFFYAESEPSNNQPGLLWYARVFDEDVNAAILSKIADNNEEYNILNLLWYKPGLFDEINLAEVDDVDYLLKNHELATFRSQFGDEMALFTGLKGYNDNTNNFSHRNLDSGTFEIYALGERFIGNYSNETYKVVPDGFWDYDYARWTYYKKNPQGQNTLVFNPEQNPVLMQDPYENAPITRFESNLNSGLSIIDLSRVYKNDALSVYRGLKMFDNRTKVMIQDEFKLRAPSTVYWSAHTEARIDIISPKVAKLTLNGKSLYAIINSEVGEFSKMKAEALPGTIGKFGNLDNKGISKLIIKLENITEATLNVVFIPTSTELNVEDLPKYDVIPLNDWELDSLNSDYKATKNLVVDDIQVKDVEFGKGYKYEFNPYTKEYVVKLATGTTKVPELDVKYDASKYDVEVSYSKVFSQATIVKVTDKETKLTTEYKYTYIVDYQIRGHESYYNVPIVSATGSEDASKLIDGATNSAGTLKSNKKEEIIFELNKVTNISHVRIRFFGGLTYQYFFNIYTSIDGVNYQAAYLNGNSNKQVGDEVYALGEVEAKYVKIVFLGEVEDDLLQVSEVSILDCMRDADSEDGDNDSGNVVNPGTNNTGLYVTIGVVTGLVILTIASCAVLILKNKKEGKKE